MMKTFFIRRLDFIRNETTRQIFDKNATKEQRVTGMKNLLKLGIIISLAEGSTDVIKDLIKGKKINLSDIAIDNIMKIVAFSRYDATKLSVEGPAKTIAKKMFPPSDWIDDPIVDMSNWFQSKQSFKTLRDIPFVGRILYSNYMQEKYNKKSPKPKSKYNKNYNKNYKKSYKKSY